MDPIFYSGVWRMDWGLGNPNTTAALIAMLMIGIWSVAYVWRKGFWLALPIFTCLGGCLVHTVSRGGLVAAGTGLAVVLWFAPRPWSRNRVVALLVALWVMIGFAIALGSYTRYGKGVLSEDKSVSNRFVVWKSAPAMMVAAPAGWGLGNASKAYSEWFQPLDRNERYISLVNSHLTWLVELGWLWRFAYIAGWSLVFIVCWPPRRAHWSSVALAVWIAFAIAATFSSVAESPWLWIVPAILLVAAVAGRIAERRPLPSFSWAVPPAVAGCICAVFWLAGRDTGGVRHYGDVTAFGAGDPQILVLSDEKVLGKLPGRTARSSYGPDMPTIALATESSQAVDASVIAISGSLASEAFASLQPLLGNAAKVVLLNPQFLPEELSLPESAYSKLRVVAGEFANSGALYSWEAKLSVERIPGAGDYLAAWPTLIASNLEKTSSNEN